MIFAQLLAKLCDRQPTSQVNRGNQASRSRLYTTALLALTLFGLGSVAARAQFNGPPSLPGQEINRPFQLTTDQAILFPPIQDTILQPGDVVKVKIYGDLDYDITGIRVSAEGDGFFPLVGVLHLQGLTLAQTAALLEEKLSASGMYRDPQISIEATDGPNQLITFIGEVHGTLPSVGNRKLLEVISAVGGLPPTASHIITINRRGVAEPIVVDIGNDPLNVRSKDIPILPGDTIIVSRIGLVYVMGAFRTVGTLSLNSYAPLTLTELAALSGGIAPTAKYSDLRIIRTVGNHRTVSVVNIKDIQNGKAPDPILQPNDIVFLVPSGFKTFFLGGTLQSVLSYASLAISLSSIR
jgi:polysaccharide export outer membrane protein